jgi:hypothetical protein
VFHRNVPLSKGNGPLARIKVREKASSKSLLFSILNSNRDVAHSEYAMVGLGFHLALNQSLTSSRYSFWASIFQSKSSSRFESYLKDPALTLRMLIFGQGLPRKFLWNWTQRISTNHGSILSSQNGKSRSDGC